MDAKERVEEIYKEVLKRNPGETEFHQAVDEVLTCLPPVIDKYPKFAERKIIRRICEPERQTIFRVPWLDDTGEVQINRGFRVQFNSALGPYKGGLRFHESVSLSIIKFLAFEQIFKNSLTGLPMGAGKGGSDFDPRGKTDDEVMKFCQSFMTELWRLIGDHTDVPAGDIGVGSREIGYLFGQYKRLTKRAESGTLTGKSIIVSGSQVRTEATGYGCTYFVEEMLKTRGQTFDGKKVLVSGAGNVAIYTLEKVTQLGGKVIAMSDTGGVIYDEDGIDLDLVKQIKEVDRERIKKYTDHKEAQFIEHGNIWDIPCDIAMPSATQNEIKARDAETLINNGCIAVGEGANMPTEPGGIKKFLAANVLFGPGKAANAGGVATSALEMQQNANHQVWSFEETDKKLHDIMSHIHTECVQASEEFDCKDNYVAGANIAGFIRVAKAMLTLGLV